VQRGTLAWLIERYRESTAWTRLSPATRRNRNNHFKQVIKTAGTAPAIEITKAAITASRERRAATPAQAHNFLDGMGGLFRWACDAQMVPSDPTDGVKNPQRKPGAGFPPWTEDDCRRLREAMADRHPATGMARRAALHRPAPAATRVQLGRQHVRDGVATICSTGRL
jgi:hypothetical protein